MTNITPGLRNVRELAERDGTWRHVPSGTPIEVGDVVELAVGDTWDPRSRQHAEVTRCHPGDVYDGTLLVLEPPGLRRSDRTVTFAGANLLGVIPRALFDRASGGLR